ncbi:MAG: ribosome small subunit-dependent GTPase A [Planctomycetota bacterium]|jgi:ribosome biogenesis GTPase
MSEPRRGVVLRDEGSQLVVDVDGAEVSCVVRKTLRRKAGKFRKAVAVGDRVQLETSADGVAIVAVEPRRSYISRHDPGQRRKEQILVANLDAVLVVASARQPDIAPGLIDRFLVDAESRELEVGVAINKIDLDPERGYGPVATVYRDLGYDVLEVSATTGAGLDSVRTFLASHTTTLLGHSGVGKSSLANALDASLDLRTADVHAGSGQGAHTTTTVSLLRLPWGDGGYLVDTPGIREFGLWRMEPSDVGHWFRDLARHLGGCRFNDCLHETEPGCAVKAAVESGEIAGWRYESYLRILQGVRDDTPDAY